MSEMANKVGKPLANGYRERDLRLTPLTPWPRPMSGRTTSLPMKP